MALILMISIYYSNITIFVACNPLATLLSCIRFIGRGNELEEPQIGAVNFVDEQDGLVAHIVSNMYAHETPLEIIMAAFICNYRIELYVSLRIIPPNCLISIGISCVTVSQIVSKSTDE